MEMKIWKFPFEINPGYIEIEMPNGAEILHVYYQSKTTCLWAIVNPENPPVTRVFKVYGTGHPIDTLEGLNYIDTIHNPFYRLVWHLFEVNPSNHKENKKCST